MIDRFNDLIYKFKTLLNSNEFWPLMFRLFYVLFILFFIVLFVDEYFVTFVTLSGIVIIATITFTVITHLNSKTIEPNIDNSEYHRQQNKVLLQALEDVLDSCKEIGIFFNGVNKYFTENNWYYDDGICVYTYEIYKSKSSAQLNIENLEIHFSNILENHLKQYSVKGISTPYYKNFENGLKVKTIDFYGIKEYPEYYEVSMIYSNDCYIQKLLERKNSNLYDKDF